MLLRKAADVLLGDIIDLEGYWCVEGVWVSEDSRHIKIVLSSRGVNLITSEGNIDFDALKTDPKTVLKRLTVRATDYIPIKTVGIVREFTDED